MIEETAIITEKNGTSVMFEIERRTACGLCGQTRGCGNAKLGKLLGHAQQPTQAENPIDANVGDHVVVGVEEKVLLRATLYLYVMPLLGLFLGAAAAQYVFQNDFYTILGCVGGLLLGLYIAKQYAQLDKKQLNVSSKAHQPHAVVLRYQSHKE